MFVLLAYIGINLLSRAHVLISEFEVTRSPGLFQRPTSALHRRLFTCQNGEECLTQILLRSNRIDAEHFLNQYI